MRLSNVALSLSIVVLTGASVLARSARAQRPTAPAAVHTARHPSPQSTPSRSLLLRPSAPSAPLPPAHIGFDKVQHFTFSFLWTVGTQYTLVVKADLSDGDALPLSVASAAVVGVAKEVYDWRRPNGTGFSRADLVADSLGIAAAVGLILL